MIVTSSENNGYRVAIVAACPFPALQGSQLLIRNLAQGLRRRGHEVVVVTYADGLAEAPADVRLVRIPRVPGCHARGSGPRPAKLLLDLVLLATLPGVLRRERIDVIHAHNYEAALVSLLASRRRVPVIYHSHNALAEELPTYFRRPLARRWARGVGRIADRVLPRRADHCIAICHELVGFLRAHGVDEDAVEMVAPGGSPAEFPARTPAELDAIRARFGLSGAPVLLYTGNLDAYQNLELLLASIGDVRARVPAAQLVFVTHATPRELPDCLRALPPGVRLIAADCFAVVRDLLQIADLALCPRREWSGFPMKLLNYMAAGKPTVVSAGSAKAIEHGRNGWVVRDSGARAYADAIVGLLADPVLRAALGTAARRTVEDEYGWDRMIDQVELIYRGVLARRAQQRITVRTAASTWRTENA